MLTALIIAWPLVAALLILLLGNKYSGWTALVSSIVSLGLVFVGLSGFETGSAAIQYELNYPWIAQFGIHFHIGMDGVSMLMVLLTNLAMPLIILSGLNTNYANRKWFFSLMLIMQTALLGVFVSLDAFLYYVFWEMALVPIYFIVLIWGGEKRIKITFKFFIYTLFGSLFMLVGIIYTYMQTGASALGAHSFDYEAFRTVSMSFKAQSFVFWAFFLAFAIKIPIFPFHTWQPDTYKQAPYQGTMLLAAIMLKMGIYSLIRWLLPTVPEAVLIWGKTAIILCVIGIVYASLIAVTQKNLKKLFAYSSMAHVGLIAAGVFSLTAQGIQGSLIQMLSHAINVIGLFFVAQIIAERTKSNELSDLGGIIHKAPLLSTVLLIIVMGSIGLPLTNGFVGEFLLLLGVYEYSFVLSIFACLTIILSAWYMLRMYQKSMLGELKPSTENFIDLRTREAIVLFSIAALVLFIGIYPKPFLDLTEPVVKELIQAKFPQNLTIE